MSVIVYEMGVLGSISRTWGENAIRVLPRPEILNPSCIIDR